MPYKAAMLELCDEVATAASMAGAVNTVQCVGDRLVGYNTDGRGMLDSLAQDAGFSPAGKRVALIGAGGAARAALVAFVLARAARVDMVNRDVIRAQDAIARVGDYLNVTEAIAVPLDAAEQAVRDADLIVNSTPVGMRPDDPSPIPTSWLRSGHIVLDMVYGRDEPTPLLLAARAAGATAIDGLGMLVGQGAIAIDIWNPDPDGPASRKTMRRAAEEEGIRRQRGSGPR
jgi:shikimate dehydrogenase